MSIPDSPSLFTESVSRQLSDFVSQTRFEALPEQTVLMTKKCLLDAIGVSYAATSMGESSDAFARLAIVQGGTQESTLFASPVRVPALMAAFANGALAHALDFEDAHDGALMHPNAANVPVALAICEAETKITGKELITALALGCEITSRMGLALTVSMDDYAWYPPPILGAYGAAATAGSLYKLDSDGMLDAFSLCLCQSVCSAEIKYSPHSTIRGVRDAFAAKSGILSAQLAREGVKGFDQPFEGKAGFYAAFARNQYDPQILVDGLGQSFEIENISFKAWPTCRGTHVYIEAALSLLEEYGFNTDEISSIHVNIDPMNLMLVEPVQQKKQPMTAIDAKFSIPYAVAAALCHGNVTLEHFASVALMDARVLALAEKVSFSVRNNSGDYFATKISGGLDIETTSGEIISRNIDKPYGCPEKPLSEEALLAKFSNCMKKSNSHKTDQQIAALAEGIFSLEDLGSVAEQLVPMLQSNQ